MIQKIKKNPIATVLFILALGAIIFFVSQLIAKPIVEILQNKITLNFYTKNVVFKFFMLLFSIISILSLNNGKLTGYGFNRPLNPKYFKLILNSSGIALASLIVGNIIFIVIMGHLFPSENTNVLPEQKSLMQMILTIWIWSSLCEEIFVRGLIQSFIQHLRHIKFLKLSLPVLISGLLFGAMHLTLYFKGMNIWFVCFIIFFTTSIGLTAAYFREKKDSLIPAIIVHFMANVVGSIPLIIKLIIS